MVWSLKSQVDSLAQEAVAQNDMLVMRYDSQHWLIYQCIYVELLASYVVMCVYVFLLYNDPYLC